MKKIISVILSFVMVVSLMVPAFANDSIEAATYIYRGKEYSGIISEGNISDYYKFDMTQSGCMRFEINADMDTLRMEVFDAYGERIWLGALFADKTTGKIDAREKVHLPGGTYYVHFGKYNAYGNYSFKPVFIPSFESFEETYDNGNDERQNADIINMDTQYNGHFGINDKKDCYKINITTLNPYIALIAENESVEILITDENGKRVWNQYATRSSEYSDIKYINVVPLKNTGTYYMTLSYVSGRGNYTFMVSSAGQVSMNKSEIGSVSNQALRTDITAKINGHDIPSYNVDGYTYICAEDLQYYGFSVVYDNDIRSLSLTRDYNQVWVSKAYTKPYVAPYEVGAHECYILLTDIATYFDGMFVNSYNINGQTIIRFDSLMAYGSMSYDDTTRTMSLWLPGIN